jgi:hypothetical protein
MPQIIDLSVPVNTVGHFDLGGGLPIKGEGASGGWARPVVILED